MILYREKHYRCKRIEVCSSSWTKIRRNNERRQRFISGNILYQISSQRYLTFIIILRRLMSETTISILHKSTHDLLLIGPFSIIESTNIDRQILITFILYFNICIFIQEKIAFQRHRYKVLSIYASYRNLLTIKLMKSKI